MNAMLEPKMAAANIHLPVAAFGTD